VQSSDVPAGGGGGGFSSANTRTGGSCDMVMSDQSGKIQASGEKQENREEKNDRLTIRGKKTLSPSRRKEIRNKRGIFGG